MRGNLIGLLALCAYRVGCDGCGPTGPATCLSATDSGASDAGFLASMGIPVILPAPDSNPSGIYAQQFTATGPGVVTAISFYIDPASSATKGDSVEIGMYSDDAGTPGALLFATQATRNPTPGAWLTLPSPPVEVTAGASYWLAYEVSGSSITFRTGTYPPVCILSGPAGPLPDPFPEPEACYQRADAWSFYMSVLGPSGPVSLGNPTPFPTIDSNDAGIFAQRVIATVDGELQSLDFFVDSSTGSDTLELGLYSDDGGFPDALLAATGTLSGPMPDAWAAVNVAPVAIARGGAYWLAYGVSGSTISFRSGDTSHICTGPGSFGPMPSSFPASANCSGNGPGEPWSFFVTVQQ